MANYVSKLIHMTDDQMQNDKLCVYMTHTKKYVNGMTCQFIYLICTVSNMLTITILANDIIYDSSYYVNISQNTYVAAYGKTHMHTPKSFHPIMDKCHTIGRK